MKRRASRSSSSMVAGRGRPASTSKLFLCRRRVLRSGRRRRRRGGSCGLRLRLCRLQSRKRGCGPRSPRRENRKGDRREHENDRGPGRRPRKNRSRTPWAKRCLAALSAESRGQVAAFSTLQQHDRNQKQANDNVDHYNQDGHYKKTPSGPRPDSNSDLA